MNDRATAIRSFDVSAVIAAEDVFGAEGDAPIRGRRGSDETLGYQPHEESDWRERLVIFGAEEQTAFQKEGSSRARAWANWRRKKREDQRQASRASRALGAKA